MDEDSQKEFDNIIALGSDSLTPDQKTFLYARRTYLNAQQRADFADIIKAKDKEIADAAQALEDERHPKKA